MSDTSKNNALSNTRFLPNERWELTLDSALGMLTYYGISASNSIILTSLRIISNTQIGDRQSITHLNIEDVASVEIIESFRSTRRLIQGLSSFGLGIIIGLALWVILGNLLLVVIGGGIPSVTGIYLLTGYLLPDDRSELLVHSRENTIRFPLLSPVARLDSHPFAHRLSELSLMRKHR